MANLLFEPSLWMAGDTSYSPAEYWWDTESGLYHFTGQDFMFMPAQPGELIGMVQFTGQSNFFGAATPELMVLHSLYSPDDEEWGTGQWLEEAEILHHVNSKIMYLNLEIAHTEGFIYIYTPAGWYGGLRLVAPLVGDSDAMQAHKVYELDRGWTFDGAYIPHYIVFNWYFGDDPTVYKTMQKVRVHGLAKGQTLLSVQTSGVQTDYRQEFTEPEFLDLLNPYDKVYEEFEPATSYADLSNRGLAIQVKFEGRNRDMNRPEPAHVLQVLIPQTSPQGSGFSSN